MRTLSIVVIFFSASVFSADDDETHLPFCTSKKISEWMDIDIAKQTLELNGYNVIKLSITESNCYELYYISQKGESSKNYLDPVTLEVVKPVYE